MAFWARVVLRLRRPRIIGITGSVGKTTTKEMIASVLTHADARPIVGAVLKGGDLNGRLGLPMTLLGYHRKPDTAARRALLFFSAPFRSLARVTFLDYPAVLVIEYGMSNKGGIAQMAKLARPEVAVVTAVGPAHIEFFKSVERVAEEKSKLVRAVPRSGLVILAQDNDYVSRMSLATQARVVKVAGTTRELSRNIAREVGRYFGLSEEIIERGLSTFQPPAGRLNILELGAFTVIDDSYNANPMSMRVGLSALKETGKPGQRKVALLGFMANLGEQTLRYHEEIGAYARECADVIIGIGGLARHYGPDHMVKDTAECIERLPQFIRRGDCVFVKGPVSLRLAQVVQALKRIAEGNF